MKTIIIKGAPGSPYTRKMLSLLRYRRIPYQFIIGGLFDKGIMNTDHLPTAKVQLMPTIYITSKRKTIQLMLIRNVMQKEPFCYSTGLLPTNSTSYFITMFIIFIARNYCWMDGWNFKFLFQILQVKNNPKAKENQQSNGAQN